MHIILSGTGHVGSAVADALLVAHEPVTIVARDDRKAADWRAKGAQVAVADIHDADALRAVFRTGTRAFLLNPPADPATDVEIEERATIAAILTALDGSGLEKVVAASTYGAQPGSRIGDLGTLYAFEQGLAEQPIPATIQRGAYYMSNWDAMLPAARKGTIPSMLPAELAIPMVAPADLGRAAARRMMERVERTGLHHVEGPARYSPRDVANAFAAALGQPVAVELIPPERWIETYRGLGFSEAAAESYAAMTRVSVDGGFTLPDDPERGTTTLEAYIAALVAT